MKLIYIYISSVVLWRIIYNLGFGGLTNTQTYKFCAETPERCEAQNLNS